MEALIVMILLGLGVLILVLPIVALAKASAASGRARHLEGRVHALEKEVAELRSVPPAPPASAQAMGRAPAAVVSPADSIAPRTADTAVAPGRFEAAVVSPPPLPAASAAPGGQRLQPVLVSPDAPSVPARVARPPASPPFPPAPPPPVPLRPAAPAFNWEQFMGAKLFAWVGGLALFLGVAFFLKYSFDRNLIPPAMRAAMGFVAGLGLLVGGIVMNRKKFLVTSHTLCATGVLVLYAVTFACRVVYHFDFFAVVPTFLLMALVTAVAFLLAVRLNAQVVAVLGLLGGFLTPVLLSTGQDQPLALFGYLALLDAGLLAVALTQRWTYLAGLAAAGTIIMQWGWFDRFFAMPKAPTALAIFGGFAVFMTAAATEAWRRRGIDRWFLAASGGLSLSAFVFAFTILGSAELSRQPALFLAAVFVPDLCLLALSLFVPCRPHFQGMGASCAFLLLALWTGRHVDGTLLNWALGSAFVFAVLHCAFPVVRQRLHPDAEPGRWLQGLPLLAIVLMLVPVLAVDDFSLLLWPVLLVIDLLIIAVAVLAGAAWVLGAALVLTVFVLACWIGDMPVSNLELLPALMVTVGGFAIVFFGLSWGLRGKLEAFMASKPRADWEKPFDAITPHLPALSAVLPFLLLTMTAARLPLSDPSPVFAVALVLVLLLLALAWLLPNGLLPLIGLFSAALLEHVWQLAHLRDAVTSGGGSVTLAWYLVFYAVIAVFPFVFRARFADQLLPSVASALAGPLHFYLVHPLVRVAWPNDFMGVIPALFAVPSMIAFGVMVNKASDASPARPAQLAWFGAVVLFFITLIIPIQFRREWITLGWALEGAALLWLFHRVPHPGLRVVGVALLLVAFTRLALNPMVLSYHPRSGQPLLNWYLYAYGLTALSLAAGAWLLRPPRDRLFGRSVPPILWALATVLLFLLVNIEIADYFAAPGDVVLTFEFSGNFARDMAYTVAWSLFALGLLVLGLGRRLALARYAGLALLATALLKLFLHDLATLPNLYRIGALLITAVIAIVASFLYQKLAASDAEEEEVPPPAP